MQVQLINNNNSQTFGALNLTSAAKTLIEQEKGGKAAIKRFTKELENSKWDLNIKTLGNDSIYPYFGKDRATCVIPSYVQDEYVMVYSSDAHSMDNEDDIVDCLKFSSKQRAKEVYDTLRNHFLAKIRTPLQHLRWDVDAMKAFTEAEIVPQKESPWAHFLKDDALHLPERKETRIIKKEETSINNIEKPSFATRLKAAWNVLIGRNPN